MVKARIRSHARAHAWPHTMRHARGRALAKRLIHALAHALGHTKANALAWALYRAWTLKVLLIRRKHISASRRKNPWMHGSFWAHGSSLVAHWAALTIRWGQSVSVVIARVVGVERLVNIVMLGLIVTVMLSKGHHFG